MASITRTAYPRIERKVLKDNELEERYQVSEKEREFVYQNARGERQQFTLLILLKTHQFLGRTGAISKVPKQIRQYLLEQTGLPGNTLPIEETEVWQLNV